MRDRAVRPADQLHRAAEADMVLDVRPLEFPGIAEGQPILGDLLLPAIRDRLPEQAVIVADAVAEGRDVEGRERFHEAGREPPEPAIAERRIRLDRAQAVEVHAEPVQRLTHLAD
ncbi:hypothetical protein JNW90_08795 [Micromonospora sp. STR1s_5]|nr:hypothetical protein [Micromonospora sp. STR1s_5]